MATPQELQTRLADLKAQADALVNRLQQQATQGAFAELSEEERNILANTYGTPYALISSNSDLMRVFIAAVNGRWEKDRFQAAVRETNWYKQNDANQRFYQVAVASGGADLETLRKRVRDELRSQVQAASGRTLTDEEMAGDVEELLKTDYQNMVSNNFVNLAKFARRKYVAQANPLDLAGEAATQTLLLRNYTRRYGLQMSNDRLSNYLSKLFAGDMTLDTFQSDVRNEALNLFPQFRDRIQAGDTIEDIAAPYRRMLGDMLEIEEGQIDMTGDGKNDRFDPLIQYALYSTDDKGNPKAMSLWDFRRAVKKDPRWQFTRNARDEYASMARELMRDFGAGV